MALSRKQFIEEITAMLDKHVEDLPEDRREIMKALMLTSTFGGRIVDKDGKDINPLDPKFDVNGKHMICAPGVSPRRRKKANDSRRRTA